MATLGPHLLGRVAPSDDAHVRAYPYTAGVLSVEVEIPRPTLSLYDQGATPRCVGYSTSKVMNFFNHYAFDADWLYAECKKIDGYPGEDGTNARAACDVLRSLGHWRTINGVKVKAGPKLSHGIASNHWATSVDAIRAVLAGREPVLLGIDWYEAWFNPTSHTASDAGSGRSITEHWLQPIAQAGGKAGGHEIGVWACSDARQACGLSNTWGRSFPDLVWVSYDTVAKLLAQGGDACVITDLASR